MDSATKLLCLTTTERFTSATSMWKHTQKPPSVLFVPILENELRHLNKWLWARSEVPWLKKKETMKNHLRMKGIRAILAKCRRYSRLVKSMKEYCHLIPSNVKYYPSFFFLMSGEKWVSPDSVQTICLRMEWDRLDELPFGFFRVNRQLVFSRYLTLVIKVRLN